MTTTLLTPMERGAARQSGASLWRKQLLPVGEINYKGRKIALTREYLAGLVKAFTDKAYDAVPLQFADEDNKHTEKPEHRRGTVRGLELTDDGLDVIVSAGPEAAKYLAEYPDLGISAKIVEEYERADGKFYPAALKHVLGTLDPRITGMRPWQEIAAANDGDGGEVIDLTDAQYDNGGGLTSGTTTITTGGGGEFSSRTITPLEVTAAGSTVGKAAPEQQELTGTPTEDTHMAFTADQEARLSRLLDLPDDKFEALLSSAEAREQDEELSDEELQALVDSLPGDDEPEDEPQEEPGPEGGKEPEKMTAVLTAEAQAAIDLANSRAEETSLELARVTSALNRAAYERERDHYSREYGIPPRITDLARQVLEGEGHVIELAGGSSIDAGAIVRKVLAEVGKTVRMLDLSGELGTPLDFSAEAEKAAEDKAAEERAALVRGVRQMTGI